MERGTGGRSSTAGGSFKGGSTPTAFAPSIRCARETRGLDDVKAPSEVPSVDSHRLASAARDLLFRSRVAHHSGRHAAAGATSASGAGHTGLPWQTQPSRRRWSATSLVYTGIGSRRAPKSALDLAGRLPAHLTHHGLTLRTGGAGAWMGQPSRRAAAPALWDTKAIHRTGLLEVFRPRTPQRWCLLRRSSGISTPSRRT